MKKAPNLCNQKLETLLMRVTGVEPARRKALDPKSSASANSATPAYSFGINSIVLFIMRHPGLEPGTPRLKV